MIKELKQHLANEHILEFFEKMKQLGFREEEALQLMEERIKGEK